MLVALAFALAPLVSLAAQKPSPVVSLEVEPVSSAPVLYGAKPFVPLEGTARVVALVSAPVGGTAGALGTLLYRWTVDGTWIEGVSGAGKNAVVVTSPLQYRSRSVSVSITKEDGTFVGEANVSIVSQEPTVRVYENDPLLGVRFDHALSGTVPLAGAEASFYAAPYSFPLINTAAPSLRWFLSGTDAQSGALITLRPAGSGKGAAPLSVSASAGESARASAQIVLSFGARAAGLFGL